MKSSWFRRNQRRLAPAVFLAPGVLIFIVYVIYPIFSSTSISFYEWDGLNQPVYIGIDNYIELTEDDNFYVSLKNNFIWLVLYMLSIPIGLAIALFLNQKVFGIRLVKSLFFAPFVVSQIVVGLTFNWFYDPNFGLLIKVLEFFGIEKVAILANEDTVTYGIIVAGLWPQIAYCMILYITGLNNINSEQIEAGRLDGAKGMKMLWNIVLPQLRPATFIAVVVTVIGALRSFDLISIMTQGGPYGSSNVLAYYMFEQALSEYGYRMGYGASIAVVLFLIMMVYITIFLVKMFIEERKES